MKLYGDYHTHTIFTHGHGTIEDNVKQAVKKGLKQIAITEHSFRHVAHPLKKKNWAVMKQEVERLRKLYDIDILLGLEANLLDAEGHIDVPEEIMKECDILVLGYHKLFWTSLKAFFTFLLPNTFRIGRASNKRIEQNTKAYMNAIEKYPINILAHLKYANCTVDCVRLGKFAKEHNVKVELNGKRIDFTDEEMIAMRDAGVEFIVDSDAHESERVGRNDHAISLILKHKIPHDQVANLDKIPNFKR